MKALQCANGNRQLSAETNFLPSHGCSPTRMKWRNFNLYPAKTDLNRNQLVYSGIKAKFIFIMTPCSQTLPIDPWRQNFPTRPESHSDGSTCLDPLKTRVNTLKYGYARIKTAAQEKFYFILTRK
jgi:hypothetical protein